jgi:Flp pilus assembly protein TadD
VDLGGPEVATARAPLASAVQTAAITQISRISPARSDVEREDVLLRALTLAKVSPTLASNLAVAMRYHQLGIFDRALDYLDKAAEFEARNPAVNDAIARSWRDWGLPEMGLSYAHRAIYAAPRSATARHTLGTLLYALRQPAAAERAFRDVVALDPLAWYGWQNLCVIVMADGRTQEATTLCQRAAAARAALKARSDDY